MNLLLSLLLLFAGAGLGAASAHDDDYSAVLGALLGLALASLYGLRRRVAGLEAQIARLAARPAPAATDELPAAPPQPVPAAAPWPDERSAAVILNVDAAPAAPAPEAPDHDGWRADAARAALPDGWAEPAGAAGTGSRSTLVARLHAWLSGGNALVRTGIVVLFFGAAFLVRYVAEHSTLSIELRLAALAATGLAGVALGWRLRTRRRGYALSLQGGGLGVIYLVLYGAMQFYGLIPPLAGFVLLVACTAAGTGLALVQDAEPLGLFAVLGGFLAPVLVATGSGDHVALFGYYLVLDLGIAALVCWRPWRRLAVLGCVCTYVIGTLWGGLRYRPELLASTEPFLLAYFALYSVLPALAARRLPPDPQRPLDAGLVFGVPVLTLALQAALLAEVEHGLAASALGIGLWYAALWRLAVRRPALALLGECYAAIALVSATLAVPLYFEAGTSSPLWALEGAGLVWVGARQARRGLLGFGVALIVAAGGLWFAAHALDAPVTHPFLRADGLDAPLLALAALVAADAAGRYRTPGVPARLDLALAGWGGGWWLLWGARETLLAALAPDTATGAWLLFLAAGTALAYGAWTRLRTGWLRAPLYALPLLLAPVALHDFLDRTHPGAGLGAAGWAAALAVHWTLLRLDAYTADTDTDTDTASRDDAAARGRRRRYAAGVWLVLALAVQEIAWFVADVAGLRFVWTRALNGAVLAVAVLALLELRRPHWPFAACGPAGRALAAGPVVLALLAWFPLAGLNGPATPDPLPFLPLLNPVELASLTALAVLARALAGRLPVPPARQPLARGLLAALAFATLNVAVLRACHHLGGVPWTAAELWDSRLVQTTLALVWATAAVLLMLAGTRRGQRTLWLAGAALMGLVVLKLFLVDLAGHDTLARILAFLGTGGLLLAVGWLAPVPPRAAIAAARPIPSPAPDSPP